MSPEHSRVSTKLGQTNRYSQPEVLALAYHDEGQSGAREFKLKVSKQLSE